MHTHTSLLALISKLMYHRKALDPVTLRCAEGNECNPASVQSPVIYFYLFYLLPALFTYIRHSQFYSEFFLIIVDGFLSSAV